MIQTLTTEVLTLTGLVAMLCFALAWAKQRYQPQRDPLVEAIDALLPQTQCAQCGYPGCRPYAEAVADGASIDLCPPGGSDTQQALAALLGRSPTLPLARPLVLKAKIDETSCVGCFLCVEACPVDAIIGAPRYLHTVLEERCTGCELCLPPCPVDCIELIPEQPLTLPPPPVNETGCIRCNRCEPVCPEALPVQQLWWFSRTDNPTQAREIGLDRCIECGLCNPECPSGLDLAGTFHSAREKLAARDLADATARLTRKHVAEREQRLARQALIASDRRSRRLAALKSARND